MKIPVLLPLHAIILPYYSLPFTQAVSITIATYTKSLAEITADIASNAPLLMDRAIIRNFMEVSEYILPAPTPRYCHNLERDIIPDANGNLRTHLVALSLAYHVDMDDLVERFYDEPVALALWKQPSKLKLLWYRVLEVLRLKSRQSWTCFGKPDLMLKFFREGRIGTDWVVLPPSLEWFKEYSNFLILQEDDERYHRWVDDKMKTLTGKPLEDYPGIT